jgi:hypothetical protein
MPPLRRTKRAAAAAAESKIKESIAKINQAVDEEEENPKKLSDLNASEEEEPRTQQYNKKRKPGSSKHTDDSHRTTKKSKNAFKTDQESQVHPSPSEASYPGLFSEYSAASNFLSFSSTSTATAPSSVTTVERERLERQRRRAARMVNSNRPMLLSRRTSYRMARSSEFASPVYSPIHANRISFTPVANKLTSSTMLVRRGHRAM